MARHQKAPTSVTLTVMEDYLDNLRGQQKMPSTVLGYMMSIRSFFSWLVDKKKITANPCAAVEYGRREYGAKDNHAEGGDAPLYCDAKLRNKLLGGWRTIPAEVMPRATAEMIAFILHAGGCRDPLRPPSS